MLSKDTELQKSYVHFLTNYLPEGFSYCEDSEDYPSVKVSVMKATETAKVVEEELRVNGYSQDMVVVKPTPDNDIHYSFDLLYFTEEHAKRCLLLIARTIYNFEETATAKVEESSLFSFLKSKRSGAKANQSKFQDIITKDDVIRAVRRFSDNLPKGTYRTILVNDDYSIDFEQLRRYLGRIPSDKFYMSKETYEIFEEQEKHIPPLMDKVQKAVDRYVSEHKQYPTMPFDNQRRVNGYLLVQERLLEKLPTIEFYITNYDGLITHVKPTR